MKTSLAGTQTPAFRPWRPKYEIVEAKTAYGKIRTLGLALPGHAHAIPRSLSEPNDGEHVFKAKKPPNGHDAWHYPGFIVSAKRGLTERTRGDVTHDVVKDLYGYLRQQWHITENVKDETIHLGRCAREARLVAKELLQKGRASQDVHDAIIARLDKLENSFSAKSFKNTHKNVAGDLFEQICVDPNPDPRKNAVHALTAHHGAKRLEQRQQETMAMRAFLEPRYLQVRSSVRIFEDELSYLAEALSKGGILLTSYAGFRNSQAKRPFLVQLRLLDERFKLFTFVMPFALHGVAARRTLAGMMNIVNEERLSIKALEDGVKKLFSSVSVMRLIVRLEQEVIGPLTLFERQNDQAIDPGTKMRWFALIQEDLNQLRSIIIAQSKLSLLFVPKLEDWIEKLRLCTLNKFEDHRIVKDDANAFVRHLALSVPT